MGSKQVFIWLIVINALLAAGDLFAKRSIEFSNRNVWMTTFALGLWVAGCCMWLPVMRSRGFTRLVALADVIGLVMIAVVGYLFLGERLSVRESAGVGCAIVAVLLLG